LLKKSASPIKTTNDQSANFEETDFGEKPTKPEAKREKNWQTKDMRMQGEHIWQDTLTFQNATKAAAQ
jgi:hypothetical protein